MSYFTFKNGQETGTGLIALWHQFVCAGFFFTPCYWREIQSLRKCQVILNGIVSPIFGVVLMKILWRTMRMMLKKAFTRKLTSRVVSPDVLTARFKCHFWGKIAQLCTLVKLTIFIAGIPNFGIVYFKRYIFILCGKIFRFIGTLNEDPLNKITGVTYDTTKNRASQKTGRLLYIHGTTSNLSTMCRVYLRHFDCVDQCIFYGWYMYKQVNAMLSRDGTSHLSLVAPSW